MSCYFVFISDYLDELPMAYNSMNEIIENNELIVDIISRIKFIYNFKATE